MYHSVDEHNQSLIKYNESSHNNQDVDPQRYIVEVLADAGEDIANYPYWNAGIALSLTEFEFCRSFLWAWLTEQEQDFFQGHLGGFWGCTLTQMISTLPLMLGVGLINVLIQRKCFSVSELHNREWLKEQIIIGASAWTAIPVWNGAQLLGQYAGSQFLSPLGADYFAGVFTGVAEDVWQNGAIPFFLRRAINKPMLALFVITGAIWQWVYTAMANNDLEHHHSAITATAVASSVAFTTLAIGLSLLVDCSSKKPLRKAEIVVLDDEPPVRITRKKKKYSVLSHSITKSPKFSSSPDIEVSSINSLPKQPGSKNRLS